MPTVIDITPSAPGVGGPCVTDCHDDTRRRRDAVGVTDERRERGRVGHRQLRATRSCGLERRPRARRRAAPARAAPAAARASPARSRCRPCTFDALRARRLQEDRVPERGDEHRGEHADRQGSWSSLAPPSRSWFSRLLCAAGVGTAVAVNVTPPAPPSFAVGDLLRARDVDVRRSAAPCPSRRSRPRASGSPSPCPGT